MHPSRRESSIALEERHSELHKQGPSRSSRGSISSQTRRRSSGVPQDIHIKLPNTFKAFEQTSSPFRASVEEPPKTIKEVVLEAMQRNKINKLNEKLPFRTHDLFFSHGQRCLNLRAKVRHVEANFSGIDPAKSKLTRVAAPMAPTLEPIDVGAPLSTIHSVSQTIMKSTERLQKAKSILSLKTMSPIGSNMSLNSAVGKRGKQPKKTRSTLKAPRKRFVYGESTKRDANEIVIPSAHITREKVVESAQSHKEKVYKLVKEIHEKNPEFSEELLLHALLRPEELAHLAARNYKINPKYFNYNYVSKAQTNQKQDSRPQTESATKATPKEIVPVLPSVSFVAPLPSVPDILKRAKKIKRKRGNIANLIAKPINSDDIIGELDEMSHVKTRIDSYWTGTQVRMLRHAHVQKSAERRMRSKSNVEGMKRYEKAVGAIGVSELFERQKSLRDALEQVARRRTISNPVYSYSKPPKYTVSDILATANVKPWTPKPLRIPTGAEHIVSFNFSKWKASAI